ncbi:hypothetical protein EST38_g459 [Candolleomyces aberdarensis]|uniref:Uncharacterized protein n=1 Tax=Candolleomyces aberdarensis TaxID=2316362 RepID=A0A4Q2DX75_9AGAR|nr:hypothetical protein EST38_g459 [Candolleomyces aberdarensis]
MPQPTAAQNQEFVPLTALPTIDVENLNVGVTALQSPVRWGARTAKALSNGPGSALVVTIEWVSGVVVFLVAFFLTDYDSEGTESAKPFFFFKTDFMNIVRKGFQHVGIRIPEYDTEEGPRESLRLNLKHPPVTGYGLMVPLAAILFAVEWTSGAVTLL